MQQKITIIDYGMGNIKSVAHAVEHVGGCAEITSSAADIQRAKKILLPGVGAFDHCMQQLDKLDLINPIRDHVQSQKLLLGICLGLQVLFEYSAEGGQVSGLGILKGAVKKFDFTALKEAGELKIPHMGWNQVNTTPDHMTHPLWQGIKSGSDFYFVHSYYVEPADKSIIMSTTDYGEEFCSSIHKDNIYACQFHPEKSQNVGLTLLKNFVAITNPQTNAIF